jgi:hypothetical protein
MESRSFPDKSQEVHSDNAESVLHTTLNASPASKESPWIVLLLKWKVMFKKYPLQ